MIRETACYLAKEFEKEGLLVPFGTTYRIAENLIAKQNECSQELVLCECCKHSEPCGESRQCLHPFGLNACDGNDFCSYGERREGE